MIVIEKANTFSLFIIFHLELLDILLLVIIFIILSLLRGEGFKNQKKTI